MFDSLFSFVLALLGLGILVIVHEAGHYYMARRCKMKVESFGIGFGNPIWSFMKDGVKFTIGWIPFGGYVKIAGMEKGSENVKDGFFSRPIWDRIKVVFWGPFANVLFAIFAFSLIWITGGREKSFSEISARVGYVDPASELYQKGLRPGDLIISYNDHPVTSSKDHLYVAMTSGDTVQVDFKKLHEAGEKEPAEHVTVHPYQHPRALEKGILTTGILAPASFLIWDPEEKVASSRSIRESDILPGDRLVWVDGEPVFSHLQLSSILNNGSIFVTVFRDGKYLHLHIPRVLVGELKLSEEVRGELSDWQHAENLQTEKLQNLWYIPYNMTSDGVIENSLSFLDDTVKKRPVGDVLLPGDRLVAIFGEPISSAALFLSKVQEKKVLVVVERNKESFEKRAYQDEDAILKNGALSQDLQRLTSSIGTEKKLQEVGSFILLNPIVPKTRKELLDASNFMIEEASRAEIEKKIVEKIDDATMRKSVEESLRQKDQELYLGLVGIRDATVMYNPSPVTLCVSIFREMYDTFSALIGGYLSPKWMSGPVGIIHVIQKQWSVGFKEVLFWLGTISLNLAILNLLPIPVLDGGYIAISLFEKLTGIRIRPETLEKIVWPFAILFIAFVVYLTYNDIIRILSQFFVSWVQ